MASRLIERSRSSVTLSIAANNHNNNNNRSSSVDGTSLCSNNSESFSEHSSNNSSPRIYLPTTTISTESTSYLPETSSTETYQSSVVQPSSCYNGLQSSSTPPLSVYPSSDVSCTDTDDSESTQSAASANGRLVLDRAESPHNGQQWRESGREECGVPADTHDDRWPPLPDKPRLAQKTAFIKKVKPREIV